MADRTVKETFEAMPGVFIGQAAEGEHAIIQWTITGEGGGNWYIIVDDGKCTVQEGINEQADAGLKISAKDFISLQSGKLSGMMAAMTGRLKISGNQAILMKLQKWFPQP